MRTTGPAQRLAQRIALAAATAATAVQGGCMVRAAQFSQSDKTAVIAVLHAQRDAWNQGDLGGYMAGYEASPELVFTSGGQIRRGWLVTRDKYQAKYGASPETMGHLEFTIDDVRGVGDGAAVVLGHWGLTETEQAGAGVFSLVFARTPAGWRVIHDHTSSDS